MFAEFSSNKFVFLSALKTLGEHLWSAFRSSTFIVQYVWPSDAFVLDLVGRLMINCHLWVLAEKWFVCLFGYRSLRVKEVWISRMQNGGVSPSGCAKNATSQSVATNKHVLWHTIHCLWLLAICHDIPKHVWARQRRPICAPSGRLPLVAEKITSYLK